MPRRRLPGGGWEELGAGSALGGSLSALSSLSLPQAPIAGGTRPPSTKRARPRKPPPDRLAGVRGETFTVAQLAALFCERAVPRGYEPADEPEVRAAAFGLTGRELGSQTKVDRSTASAIFDRLEREQQQRRPRLRIVLGPDGRPALDPDPVGLGNPRAVLAEYGRLLTRQWRRAKVAQVDAMVKADRIGRGEAARRLGLELPTVSRWRRQAGA